MTATTAERRRPTGRPLPLVLMYHGVGDVPARQDPSNLFVRGEVLAHQLDRLGARGWSVVGEDTFLAAVAGARPAPRRSVLITFDDGYVSVLHDAAPLLARRGMPATCFVSPGLLGRGPGAGGPSEDTLLDAEQMVALQERGVTLGCHGWSHGSMAGADPETLERSTVGARAALQTIAGRAPRTFAYPFGHHDAAAREAVRRAGFACGFATYDSAGRMAFPRVDVNALDTPRSFDLKLYRAYPTARRALARAPVVRQLVHRGVGYAPRS